VVRDAVLILGGDNRQAVSIARSLSIGGYRTIVGQESERTPASSSRFTDESWRHPSLADHPDAFLTALANLRESRPELRWVFPVGESELRFMLRHWDTMPDRERIVMPSREAVEACFDKPRFYELARECGVPFAPFGVAHDATELDSWIARIGYPLVIKPEASVGEIGGRRALVVADPAGLRRLLPAWPGNLDALIVQRFAPGLRHNCHFVAHEGRLIAYFEHRVERTNRRDGTRNAVESVSVPPTPRLLEYTSRLAERLRYSGPGDSQFLVADADHPVLLELNARLDANVEAARRCGADVALLALEVVRARNAETRPLPGSPAPYALGRRCHWLTGDLAGAISELRSGEISAGEAAAWLARILRAELSADFHLVGWMRDPKPAMHEAWSSLPNPISMTLRRVRRMYPG
jgi:biotin carboxylase